MIDFWINLAHRIPEFLKLKEISQHTLWHKEGDAYTHTMNVYRQMCDIIKRENIIDDNSINCLLGAAIFHDIGKGFTTEFNMEKNQWTCRMHDMVGAKEFNRLLKGKINLELRLKIATLIRWHMLLHDKNISEEKIIKHLKEFSKYGGARDFILLYEADCNGSMNDIDTPDKVRERVSMLTSLAKSLGCYDKPYKEVKDDFTVTIMVGIMGSGKDTWIRENCPSSLILCRDDIREEIKDGQVLGRKIYFHKEKEYEVTRILNERMNEYLDKKVSFVVNAMHINMKYRKELIENIQSKANPHIRIVYLETDCVTTNIKRREGMIPEEVIRSAEKRIDYPYYTECDEMILQTT